MSQNVFPTLIAQHGPEATRQIASAYESALLVISLGQCARMPDRRTRLALVSAIIAEGSRNGFRSDRMAEAGLAAVG